MAIPRFFRYAALALCATLGACDMLGIESGADMATRKESEGKAIGSACRHAMRAIEDCYTLNRKASKSAVFAGWREMDEYMRENKLEGIAPVIPRVAAAASVPAEGDTAPAGTEAAADKEKSHSKPSH
jgi:hypothetical protein